MNILKTIDHTLLKQNLEKGQLRQHCQEAIDYKFYSVMVHPLQVSAAKQFLKNSGVIVGTVISFPFGEDLSEIKAMQAELAIKDGAEEVDMVMAVSKAKEGDWEYVTDDIKKVKKACRGKILKVIIETCFLTGEEIEKSCELCILAGADFVKTSTGFFSGGATVENIKIMKDICKDKIKIKASGGIRNLSDAKAMLNAGADRIGSSSGVKIAHELGENKI